MVQPKISRPWWPNCQEQPADTPTNDPLCQACQRDRPFGTSNHSVAVLHASAHVDDARRNVIRAARRAATISIASTITAFASSQIAFAAGISDVAEPPALIVPAEDTSQLASPIGDLGSPEAPIPHVEVTIPASSNPDASPKSPEPPKSPEFPEFPESEQNVNAALNANADTACQGDRPLGTLTATASPMAAATTGIVDEDSLMAAIEEAIANHETDITINLNSGFTVFKPIALNNVESFTLNLTGNTLTCNGDVFNVSGETTITIIGSGSIRAGGNLVTSTGTGRIVVTQIGGDITVRQLFSRATNWVYDLISGTLSLSQTVEMGANTVLEAEKNTTISSTASDSAVHLANPSAAFNLAGSLSATGTGVAMDASTQLNVEDSAKLTAGGNAIAAGTDCKITIGARSSVTAGKRVLALGDAGSGSGSVATGTSVKSGGNVALSDGTIAPYLENGAVVTFDSTKAAGNRFATVAVANPEAQSWYGSIDDVWCLTKADYDALYALLGKGSAVDPGGEEVVGPGADPVFPPATAGDGIGSGAEGAASADSTGGAVSVSGSGSLWNATRASTGAIGTPLAVTGDDNAATAGALALGVEAALAALLISRTNLFLATNARFRRLRRSPRRPGRRSLLRGHDVP